MPIRLLLLFLICTCISTANAQINRNSNFIEFGIGLAATNYSGDMAEPHLELVQTRIGGQLFVRYQLHPNFLVRGQVFGGVVAGDDKHSPVHAGRNFKFSTTLVEVSGLLEMALGTYAYDPLFSASTLYISPYLFGGVGACFARPKVTYYGSEARRDYFVRAPLPEGGTGQTLLVAPFGVGVRMIARQQLSFGLEATARPTFSDLFDGVSQNGNSTERDWYYTVGVTVSYYLNGPWNPADTNF
ncbi:MAG: DUF6089 family protein [Saprospiraceae bacterium]|nr:hypothetical protein [Lewinellaceae bacterium]